MTIETEAVRANYTGNGVATVFAFPFKIFAATDLRVLVSGTDTDPSGYTVTSAGADGGGSVSFTVPPASGVPILLLSDVPYTQPTDFRNQGVFYASRHETAYDRSTSQIAQLSDFSSHAMRTPIVEGPQSELPGASSRAGGYLGFDASGVPTIYSAPVGSMGDVSSLKSVINTTGLRALTTSTNVCFMQGYSAVGDGMGGLVYLDTSDTTSADNGGTIFVDAAGRRWKRSFTGPLDTRMFGIAGDGITDVTAKLNAAITAAAASTSKRLKISGNCLVTNAITLTSGLTLEGNPATDKITFNFVTANTTIILGGTLLSNVFIRGLAFDVTNCLGRIGFVSSTKCGITGCSLNGSITATGVIILIYADSSTDFTCADNTFTNLCHDCVWCASAIRPIITGNRFQTIRQRSGGGGSNRAVQAGGSNGALIANNEFRDIQSTQTSVYNMVAGIDVGGADQVVIADNNFTDVEIGMDLEGGNGANNCQNVTVTGNQLYTTLGKGIGIFFANYTVAVVTVTGNSIAGYPAAITASACVLLDIVSNTINIAEGQIGGSFDGCYACNVNDNVIRSNNGTAGVGNFTVTAGGSGYTTATVTASNGATGTATIVGGAITAIAVATIGSAVSTNPTATVTGDGSGAAATAQIGANYGVRWYNSGGDIWSEGNAGGSICNNTFHGIFGLAAAYVHNYNSSSSVAGGELFPQEPVSFVGNSLKDTRTAAANRTSIYDLFGNVISRLNTSNIGTQNLTATPNVRFGNYYRFSLGTAITVTDFLNGAGCVGQEIEIEIRTYSGGVATFDLTGTNLKGNGTADFTIGNSGDTVNPYYGIVRAKYVYDSYGIGNSKWILSYAQGK